MESKNPNPISPFVAGQLPEFVRVDHPTMVAFLNAYYEWLDDDKTYLRSPKRLKEVVDIDQTMEEFLEYFKKEFLFEFPETLAITDDKTLVDTVKLAKNIKSFYSAKGTEKTYDFLFRILYDTAVEFYYPKKDILKLSDGKWILKKAVKLSNAIGKQIYDSLGQTLIQRNQSGAIVASGRVLDVSTYRIGIYDVAELSLGGINGEFQSGYLGVEFTDKDGNLRKENRVFSVLGEITITNGGSNYRVGDRVVFTPAANDTGVKGSARVSDVDSTGAIRKIVIDNFGVNYKAAPTLSIQSEIGSGFAGTITVKGQAEYPGYYANNDGRLSSNKVVQDNRYYQDFSYVLLTEITVDRYRDVVRRLLNPAGMAFYGKVLLKRCAYADLNQTTSLVQYDVPIIGHYLPYTFLTYDDLSKWFRTYTTSNGQTVASLGGYNRELHDPFIQQDFSSESLGVSDGKVDVWDFNWFKDSAADRGLPEPTFSDFLKVIGNPVTALMQYTVTDNPIKTTGFKNADPFWIVYQHPNRRMVDPVVARIPYDLKNEFLTNHGGAADFGIPTPTGASGTSGYWKEWTEDVTANREAWATGFTSGERYVMLSYNPLVPFYSGQGGLASLTPAIQSESLTAYREGSTGQDGNPTFLYDPFSVKFDAVFQGSNIVKNYEDFIQEGQPYPTGPKHLGGKRLYKVTSKEVYASVGTTTPTLNDVVGAVLSVLQDKELDSSGYEYIMLDLDAIFSRATIQNTYKTESDTPLEKESIVNDMIYVIRRVKNSYPNCRIGYYGYPSVPSFVWLVEDLYRSIENYSVEDQKKIAIRAAENVRRLIQEQGVMYLDCNTKTPSTDKLKVQIRRAIDSAEYLNEQFVMNKIKRKKIIICSSRIYQTNSKEVPNFFISSASGVRDYLPEYTIMKPSVFADIYRDIFDDSNYGQISIDGFYNTLDPKTIYDILFGGTGPESVYADYNNTPNIFNQDRSTNTNSYKTLMRRSFNAYNHYAYGYTGAGGTGTGVYSTTGPTAMSPSYWFPETRKIDSNIASPDVARTVIAESLILPLYTSYNYILSQYWAPPENPITTPMGNIDRGEYAVIENTPEGISGYGGFLVGDLDGSGVIDNGDLALVLLSWPTSVTGPSGSWYEAPSDEPQQMVAGMETATGELLGYNIAYSDFRKITARAFFEIPVGKEFNCTTDQLTPPPFPQVYAEEINGSTGPITNDFDYRNEGNIASGGDNLILKIAAVRGITGTPTEGVSSLVYLGYYGIRTLWAELYAVNPTNGEEYLLANAGPFRPTSTTISINAPFPNFDNPETTDRMFTCNHFVADSTSFQYRGGSIVKDRFFMRLKLVMRNSSNAIVPESTRIIDFNYNKTS